MMARLALLLLLSVACFPKPALVPQPVAIIEHTPFDVDTTTILKLLKYYTAADDDNLAQLACLYGKVDSAGVHVDSIVTKRYCEPPSFGALGVFKQYLTDSEIKLLIGTFCADIKKKGYDFLGAIHGIGVILDSQGKPHRVPQIWGCWRPPARDTTTHVPHLGIPSSDSVPHSMPLLS